MEALDCMLGEKGLKHRIVLQPIEGFKPPYEPHFLGEGCKFCVDEKDCQVQCTKYGEEEDEALKLDEQKGAE
jgi:hypothetical protein